MRVCTIVNVYGGGTNRKKNKKNKIYGLGVNSQPETQGFWNMVKKLTSTDMRRLNTFMCNSLHSKTIGHV